MLETVGIVILVIGVGALALVALGAIAAVIGQAWSH